MLNGIGNVIALDVYGGPPVAVVSGASATGTGSSFMFTVCDNPSGRSRVVSFQPVTTGTPVTITANLEASSDGGTTWATYPSGSALAFVATSASAWAQVANLVQGPLYRLNITTLSGGTVTIYATVG